MPFDHVIELYYQLPGERDQYGEYVPGEFVTARLWAESQDGGTEDSVDEAGTIVVNYRTFRIRWNRTIALAAPEQITVTDGLDRTYSVSTIRVDDERRRYIELDVVESVRG